VFSLLKVNRSDASQTRLLIGNEVRYWHSSLNSDLLALLNPLTMLVKATSMVTVKHLSSDPSGAIHLTNSLRVRVLGRAN
jgi:hypothetical protein